MNLLKLITFYLMVQASLAFAETPVTFCTAQEKTYFSCSLNKKVVSVCGSEKISTTTGYLQYRIGKPGKSPELDIPRDKTQPQNFFAYGAVSRSAKGSIQNLTFDSGDYNYTIYRFTHAFEGNSSGVAVKKQGKIISYIRCNEKSVIDNLYDINSLSFGNINSKDIVNEPE